MTDSNTPMLIYSALILFAYLVGSIASAIVVCKLMGLGDPRSHGSKNPGATNVMRLHGKKAAMLTLAGDVLKGVIPILLAKTIKAPDMVIAFAGVAAFAGHLYPVFFGFRGGKGVATFVGVLLGTSWLLGLAFIGTWLIVAFLFRYSSLAALVAAILTPVYTALLLTSPYYIACQILMVIFLFWRHRSNIKKLIAAKEDKIELNKI
ncbi:MAG: glycerol-3-phosphate 1-O-acyltransferase PlsY [Gammaproteobacteria bacterium]